MFFPGAAFYMDKIAVGADAAAVIDIDASPTENVRRVAEAKGKHVRATSPSSCSSATGTSALIAELREAGARVNLIRDGDVAPAIAAAQAATGVDLLMGIGGTPEGVISAAALKCVGGALQGQLWPRDDEERQKLARRRLRPRPRADDRRPRRRRGHLRRRHGGHERRAPAGRAHDRDGAVTDSIVMRSRSGTVRRIEARHRFDKLSKLSDVSY